MAFFQSAIDVLKTLVIALGAGRGVWGIVNLLEGYGNDNPGAKSAGGYSSKAPSRERRWLRSVGQDFQS